MLKPPLEPMLARPVDRLPAPEALHGGAAYEPKWGGYRTVLFVDTDGVVVQSRRGKDITASFPEIAAAAGSQLPRGTVLDGELVVLGAGSLDFTALQRRIVSPRRGQQLAAEQPASFVAFDLLAALTSSSPALAAIRAVAWMPSTFGIRMSMSTTSGRVRRSCSTASSPLVASPTTSMSSSMSSSRRKPDRTSPSSSGSSTFNGAFRTVTPTRLWGRAAGPR